MNPEDEVIELAARLARTGRVDDKTGFGNLLQLLSDLSRELARSRRTGRVFDLVVFETNSEMDPSEIAVRLRPWLRDEDVVARIGGHRYAMIIGDSRSEEGRRAGRQLQVGLHSVSPFSLGRRVVPASDQAGATPVGLLRQATAALRSASQLGGEGVVTWKGKAELVN